jgi:putative transposase
MGKLLIIVAMSHKFQNKYRITSARLQSWDYSSNKAYFITICTKNRKHYLGEFVCLGMASSDYLKKQSASNSSNFIMQLSEIGQVVESEWLKTPGIQH